MPKSSLESFDHSLDLDEDIDLHHKGWLIQRIFWVVFVIILILTAFGLFGNGLLSSRETLSGPNSIVYEHFARHQSETDLKVRAVPTGGFVRIAFHKGYLEEFKIETIFPQPYDQQFKDGSHIYFFVAEEPIDVIFSLSPKMVGSMETLVNVNGVNIPVNHFIYP